MVLDLGLPDAGGIDVLRQILAPTAPATASIPSTR
jgi:DNA-binding response OmpR family regulator